MNILLTGASGMVGKNILGHPNAKKYNFLTPSSSDLDLLNSNKVEQYIQKYSPDFVIHAAGKVGGIQANMAHPVSFLIDNLEMGKNIVTASHKNGVKELINLGSSCMYPRNAINPLSEDLILKGELEPTNEGYALAKIMSAKLCEYINKQENSFKYKTIIPCNLYGRFDKFDSKHSHMIPAVIKKIHDAKVNNIEIIDIWGDGTARREFMFAEDLADFIYFSIDNFELLEQNTNVGLGVDYTITQYYETIAKVIGYKGKFVHDVSKPVGMKQKLIENSKIKAMNWKHKTSLEQGIRKTYNFYKEQLTDEI